MLLIHLCLKWAHDNRYMISFNFEGIAVIIIIQQWVYTHQFYIGTVGRDNYTPSWPYNNEYIPINFI